MCENLKLVSQQIKDYATSIGFDACGICKAEKVDFKISNYVDNWVKSGHNAGMDYLSKNKEPRYDPSLLVENAKSIICVALNYYPQIKQNEDVPQFAYYAYGKDYHDIVKAKLRELLSYVESIIPNTGGRVFCDTAPVLERYWAAKSGIGFIGKNTMLIMPRKGSYFFLGEIILDVELEYDNPLNISCGNCTRCLNACPTKALEEEYQLNSNKCISYQTIENKGDISDEIKPLLSYRVYGCDICQQVCPWNRFAKPHDVEEFNPKKSFLDLTYESLSNLTVEEYREIFRGSAVKRAKYEGLMRNISALKK